MKSEPIPIACTLPSEAMPDRLGAWNAVLARAENRERTADGVRLRFPAEPALTASLAELAVQEAECCAFFTFDLRIDAEGTSLTVGAPPDALELVLALFGSEHAAAE